MAAKIFSEYAFKHTVKFVAFSGEKNGLYGSSAYARDAYKHGERIIADIQLDGVGHAVSRRGGNIIRLSTNGESTWITDIAQDMIDMYGNYIELGILRQRNFPGSDHQSFLNYGYEGVFFLEYEFNPHYHSPQDTIEHVNISCASLLLQP
ncbi:MAG: M28 family peptidase [Candidatus Thermoplasmatota archaeon]|nr:M28 family peptidase [Candidatus Thermoplasmatota archaeon]